MALLAVSLAIVLCERPTSKGVHAESTNKMFGVPFLVESIDNTPCDCLATSSTQASGLLVVMNLTVWFPSMLVKRTTSKGLLAVLAHEVLWVPLLTQGIDAFPADGLVARATSRSKGTIEAVLAVGPRILFKERAPFEGAEALRADEVIDVPLFVESCHAAVQDRLVTVCATSAKQLLVTLLAVREAILFVEIVGAQGVLTVPAHKMLRVVCVAKCLDYFTKDRVVAR